MKPVAVYIPQAKAWGLDGGVVKMYASGLIWSSMFPRVVGVRHKHWYIMFYTRMKCAFHTCFRCDQFVINKQFGAVVEYMCVQIQSRFIREYNLFRSSSLPEFDSTPSRCQFTVWLNIKCVLNQVSDFIFV